MPTTGARREEGGRENQTLKYQNADPGMMVGADGGADRSQTCLVTNVPRLIREPTVGCLVSSYCFTSDQM